jgi:hypothetical protein
MTKRILQTGLLSVVTTFLFSACNLFSTCGCQAFPIANLGLSSNAGSIQRGSSGQISVKATGVDENTWPLNVVVNADSQPQTVKLPPGVSVNPLVLTKEVPNGVLTLTIDQAVTPGTYRLTIYPTSSYTPKGFWYSPYSYFDLTITDKP